MSTSQPAAILLLQSVVCGFGHLGHSGPDLVLTARYHRTVILFVRRGGLKLQCLAPWFDWFAIAYDYQVLTRKMWECIFHRQYMGTFRCHLLGVKVKEQRQVHSWNEEKRRSYFFCAIISKFFDMMNFLTRSSRERAGKSWPLMVLEWKNERGHFHLCRF